MFEARPLEDTFMVIAWGEYRVDLKPTYDGTITGSLEDQMEKLRARLTSSRSPILWHDGEALNARWREARRRFYETAGASVWLDTIESALKMHAEKYPDRYSTSQVEV